jgi:hypothetical protein
MRRAAGQPRRPQVLRGDLLDWPSVEAALETHWPRLRVWPRLKPGASRARMSAQRKHDVASTLVTNVVHRFEESIAGRPYLIQVAAVSPDRWRADLVPVPGARSALMPHQR